MDEDRQISEERSHDSTDDELAPEDGDHEEPSDSSSEDRSHNMRSPDYRIRDPSPEDFYIEDMDEDDSCHYPKRRKKEETPKQDRISGMPDSILLHIMSLLPTKDVVKTGTLSPRWSYLWTSVSNLTFIYKGKRLRKFTTFVDKTLFFHKRCKVSKFVLDFKLNYPHSTSLACRIDAWVRFATEANVEELCLFINGADSNDNDVVDHYVLPQRVYKNSTLKNLSLESCILVRNGLISWKSLKNLSIRDAMLSDGLIQNILEGSPVLEFLELHEIAGLRRLDISSRSLKKLVIRDYFVDAPLLKTSASLEISAPNLLSLRFLGSYGAENIKLLHMQSLVECDLDFSYPFLGYYHKEYKSHCSNVLRELLCSIGHVEKLTIGTWCVQVLSLLELKGLGYALCKCQSLTLNMSIIEADLPGIAHLLQNSPWLETLVIDMTIPYNRQYQLVVDSSDNYWESRKGSFKVPFLHLKTIKIAELKEGSCYGLEFIKFLLEKARVLEKMIINPGRDCSMQILRLAQKLLGLPRLSTRAVISFSGDKQCFSLVTSNVLTYSIIFITIWDVFSAT